jgi:Mg-chelatase subunit ChlD
MTNLPDVSFDPTNPDPRCACVLVLDTSGSMHGEKIDQLNQGLIAFRDSLQSDSVAQSRDRNRNRHLWSSPVAPRL